MSFPDWTIPAVKVLSASKIMPVLVINDIEDAIPLATALFAGGIHALEVTLRTPRALDAIKLLIATFPHALIGAGTVKNVEQLQQVIDAGATFAISPGKTQSLLNTGCKAPIPLIPGVSSVSELMEGLEAGYDCFKLFPAEAIGGLALLKSWYGPFPEVKFCPTGGINATNYRDYLALPNVSCVGGSWIVPEVAIKTKDWALITHLSLAINKE